MERGVAVGGDVLAALVHDRPHQARKADRVHDHALVSVDVELVLEGLGGRAAHELDQAGAQPVEAGVGGEGVVHARRQGPRGDLDQLIDQKQDVLEVGALRADGEAGAHGVGQLVPVAILDRRRPALAPHAHHGVAHRHERARAQEDPGNQPALFRRSAQMVEIELLQVAGIVGRDVEPVIRPIAPFQDRGRAIRPTIPVTTAAIRVDRRTVLERVGQQLVDRRLEIATDACRDIHDVDGFGHVVDEEDQDPDRGQHQDHGDHDRGLRHKGVDLAGVAIGVRMDRAQHHHAVHKGADKGAKGKLVAPVAHEIADQARSVIARRKGNGRDRDRKGDARDADNRARDRGQHGARAVHVERGQERNVLDPSIAHGRVDHWHKEAQRESAQRHGRRYEPVGVAHLMKEVEKITPHRSPVGYGKPDPTAGGNAASGRPVPRPRQGDGVPRMGGTPWKRRRGLVLVASPR